MMRGTLFSSTGKSSLPLMIECGLGVSVQKVYQIKRIDSDYFSDSL